MATNLLRCILVVGMTATVAGMAWGDAMYMFSRQDGSVYFGAAPATPRFNVYSTPRRLENRKRLITSAGPMNINGILSEKARYDLLVDEVARGYQLDSALLHALISVESRYNPKALSPAGAAGLMQLMPATARRYGVNDVLDPEQNLHGGARYLRDLLSMFGSDVRLALAAYHAGEYAVTRHQNNIPPFQSTIDFVARVLDLYHRYRGLSGH